MPGTTPVYGFPYPEPTDLVADYPALGQDLAEDIEAVLPTLGGWTMLTHNAFTAQSAVNIDSVFSSTYLTYKVIVATTTASGTGNNITFQWRKAAVNQANGYYGAVNAVNFNGTAVNLLTNNAASMTLNTTSTSGCYIQFDVSNVNNAGYPVITGITVGENRVAGAVLGATRTTADSYTGFNITAASGTITGTITVWGYKK